MAQAFFALFASLVLGVGALFGCSKEASTPGRGLPLPRPDTTTSVPHTGPFAVGKRSAPFVDPTRKTPANGSEPQHDGRTLETLIMYPARGPARGDHSPVAGALPAPGRFPLVVYAHGLGGGSESPYLREWAAAGYIVAAPSFPLTRQDAPGGPNPIDVPNEPADVRFVISRMLSYPSLQSLINAKEIGVVGASLGAHVAMTVAYNDCCQDLRIKAVVAVAGGCPIGCTHGAGPIEEPYGHYFVRPPIPIMFIHGTADPYAPYQSSVDEFQRAPRPKFLVTLEGAKHIA